MMETDYLIWSNEHCGWWRPGGFGYCQSLAEAGRYSHAEAIDIAARAIPGDAQRMEMLPELPVRLADLQMMRDHYRGRYPDQPAEPWE